MPVFELNSYRKRFAEGATPDILIYDELPEPVRVQIIRIWKNAIGPAHVYTDILETGTEYEDNDVWHEIHEIVVQEHGLFRLSNDTNLFDRRLGR